MGKRGVSVLLVEGGKFWVWLGGSVEVSVRVWGKLGS